MSIYPSLPRPGVEFAALDDRRAARPPAWSIVWRLWLRREQAADLLDRLGRLESPRADPLRLAGVLDDRGLWLYIWPPSGLDLRPALGHYGAATPIPPELVHTGPVVAYGRALAQLLGLRASRARELGNGKL